MALVLLGAMLSCGMVFFAAFAVVLRTLRIDRTLADGEPTPYPDPPDWAAVASVRMFWLAITGRLDERP